MGESMKEVFTSQQIFNRTMKDTLEASTKAKEKQTEALEKLNISTKQRDHNNNNNNNNLFAFDMSH